MAIFNLNNPYEAQQFKEYCNAQYKRGGIVEVKRKHPQRSMKQNSYLHVCLGYFASEQGYTIEQVKYEFFKLKLNSDIFYKEEVNKKGNIVRRLRSSAELDRAEMTLAIERFRNWSAAEVGLYIPAPNENEMLAFAQRQIENYKEFLHGD